MPTIQQINRAKALYTNFANNQFPLDCEGMDLMQVNNALISVLGNIGGNRYLLIEPTPDTNNSGYAFLATLDSPLGELLYIKSVPAQTGWLRLVKNPVNITAQGYSYEPAYEERYLEWVTVPSIAEENFAYPGTGTDQFKQLETNASLRDRLDALTVEVSKIDPTPVGMMMMWGHDVIMPDTTAAGQPSNWLPCQGQSLQRVDYPVLFSKIGTKFKHPQTNAEPGANEFFLPDLRGRFPLMFGGVTNAGIGAKGGSETHTLTEQQMPSHKHTVKFTKGGYSSGTSTYRSDWMFENSGGSEAVGESTYSGSGQPHNNMPPYLAINFIIKVK